MIGQCGAAVETDGGMARASTGYCLRPVGHSGPHVIHLNTEDLDE